jgi:hypothetical protein
MPDVHCSGSEWFASPGIHERDTQLQRDAGLALGHISPGFSEIDIIWALLLFRRQRASGRGREYSGCRGNNGGSSDHE